MSVLRHEVDAPPVRRSGPRHAAPRRLTLTRAPRLVPTADVGGTTLIAAPVPIIHAVAPLAPDPRNLACEGPPSSGDPTRRSALHRQGWALALLLLGFVFQVQVGSGLHHARAQQVAYTQIRAELAKGTAPISARSEDGTPLARGRPIAILDVPSAGIREVVLEGSDGSVLENGPGRRPDSAFPGQAGTAVVYGRQATYGGPFGKIGRLSRGALIRVTTGQGTSTYQVIDRRRPGDLEPPPLGTGKGRLTLQTAAGTAFLPSGILFVDADLTSPTLPSTGAAPVGVTEDELPLASDGLALVGIAICAQLLLAVVLGLAWARLRWGRWQTWVVAVPAITAIGIALFDRVALLLPNLM
jgi:sortase (surface protein transpeptidase)